MHLQSALLLWSSNRADKVQRPCTGVLIEIFDNIVHCLIPEGDNDMASVTSIAITCQAFTKHNLASSHQMHDRYFVDRASGIWSIQVSQSLTSLIFLSLCPADFSSITGTHRLGEI
jgi:hypothetical protein